MELFIQFVINHWALWLVLAVLIGLLLQMELSTQVGGVKLVSPVQMTNLMNHDNAFVIDSRDDKAFKEGHIIGATNISQDDFDRKLKKLQKYKNKAVVVYCVVGQGSLKFGSKLIKEGFEQVYSLKGGIKAWTAANMPVTK